MRTRPLLVAARVMKVGREQPSAAKDALAGCVRRERDGELGELGPCSRGAACGGSGLEFVGDLRRRRVLAQGDVAGALFRVPDEPGGGDDGAIAAARVRAPP